VARLWAPCRNSLPAFELSCTIEAGQLAGKARVGAERLPYRRIDHLNGQRGSEADQQRYRNSQHRIIPRLVPHWGEG
jgi:hypothetical protein